MPGSVANVDGKIGTRARVNAAIRMAFKLIIASAVMIDGIIVGTTAGMDAGATRAVIGTVVCAANVDARIGLQRLASVATPMAMKHRGASAVTIEAC